MHNIKEKFKIIIVPNRMRYSVSPNNSLLIIFQFIFSLLFPLSLPPDGQLLEGAQKSLS